jgi:hypothetical protein
VHYFMQLPIYYIVNNNKYSLFWSEVDTNRSTNVLESPRAIYPAYCFGEEEGSEEDGRRVLCAYMYRKGASSRTSYVQSVT